ncbi:type IV pilin protein [Noviherbaspirillum agri]
MATANRRQRLPYGFTFIEILFVLALFALLAGIAYPTYVESVRKGKRVEARAALFQLMQQQERYFSQNNTYLAFSADSMDVDERKFKWYSAGSAENSAYELKAEACENDTIRNCVRLVAMPGTDKVDGNFRDPVCGEMIVTSTGIKRARHPDCWK